MIIKRKIQKKVHPRDLYIVSPFDNLDGELIYPKVPNNILTRNRWEDWKTQRISLFPTIQGALMSLSSYGTSLRGKVLTVYSPVGGSMESLIKPKIQDSPTSQETGEYWYLSSIKLREIAKIEILGKNGEKKIFHYGPRSTIGYLVGWEWKEILKPWEKIGKLEEKEFGIVSDIYHSGIPRTYKKYVGRARKKIAKKLEDDIIRSNKEMSVLNDKLSSRKGVRDISDLGVENKLKSLASKKYNTKTWDAVFTGGDEGVIPTKELDVKKKAMDIAQNSRKRKHHNLDYLEIRRKKKYSKEKDIERYIKNASSAKYNIDHFRGDTPGLAHEIGHVMNYESKNPITRFHNNMSNKYVDDVRYYKPRENDSIIKGIKNYFKYRSLIREESNASKKGLKLLKKLGYNKNKLKLAKEELGESLKSYKLGGQSSYKSPLAMKIQIPSRRKSTYNNIKESTKNRR